MSDFGSLAKDAVEWTGAKEFLSYKSVMDSLSATFGEHRNLVYDFPTSAIMPQDYIGVGQDRMYNFKWEAEKIYRFRGAHWSNIRVTPSFLKDTGARKEIQSAVKKIETGGSKSKRKDFEKEIQKAIHYRIQEKYQKKFIDLYSDSPKSYEERRKWYLAKFGLTGKVAADIPPGKLAEAIANQVMERKAEHYKTVLDKATNAEYGARFERLVGGKERAGEKQTKMMASKASRGITKSTFVAYEIQYEVLRISRDDVVDRFDELGRKLNEAWQERRNELRQEQNRLRQQFNDLMRSLGTRYGEGLSDSEKAAIRDQLADVKNEQESLKKDARRLKKEFRGYRERITDFEKKVWEVMRTRRRIGKFVIYPVGDCKGAETTIRWRNTDASLKATCMGLSDGRIRVGLDWSEKSFLSLPGIPKELTSNTYAINGGMKFDKDGKYEVDGKLGKRFKAMANDGAEQVLLGDDYPGTFPWADTKTKAGSS